MEGWRERYIERSFYFSLWLWYYWRASGPNCHSTFSVRLVGGGICASFVPFLCIYYKKLKRYHSRCKTPIKLMSDIRLCIYFNFLLFEYIVRTRVDVPIHIFFFFYFLRIPLNLLVCCRYLTYEHPQSTYNEWFYILYSNNTYNV